MARWKSSSSIPLYQFRFFPLLGRSQRSGPIWLELGRRDFHYILAIVREVWKYPYLQRPQYVGRHDYVLLFILGCILFQVVLIRRCIHTDVVNRALGKKDDIPYHRLNCAITIVAAPHKKSRSRSYRYTSIKPSILFLQLYIEATIAKFEVNLCKFYR